MTQYTNNRFLKFTPEGGLAVKLTNKTGSNSVKGTVIEASITNDNAFGITDTEDFMPIGVVYENGIADGSECWIVVQGIAEILLEDNTAATSGYWVKTSDSEAGRANATTAIPSGGTINALNEHMRELGHCIETKTAGTNILVKIIMHFN